MESSPLLTTYPSLPFLRVKTRDRRGAYSLRAHSHREVSLGFIRAGETRITVEGQEYLLRRGDMVLIPAGMVHLCTPEDREAFRFDMLYIDGEWWRTTLGRSPEGFAVLALPGPESLERFLGLLRVPPADPALPEKLLAEFLNGLILDYRDGEECRSSLEAVHRDICRLPHMAVPLEELARRAGMGKFAFIRKYASHYGLTPHADRINMRVQRSILLFGTDMPLAEIGIACGFSDQSHFINQFRLYTGMTPREYREALSRG